MMIRPASEREHDTKHITLAVPLESVAEMVFGFIRFVVGRKLIVFVWAEMVLSLIQDVVQHELKEWP